jgi:hypothetical protein
MRTARCEGAPITYMANRAGNGLHDTPTVRSALGAGRKAIQQGAGIGMTGCLKQRFDRAALNDLAGIHHSYAVGDLRYDT